MSHHVSLLFSYTISTLTLSHKKNIKILVSIHPHLSRSVIELIYHYVYCMPHSSLFMLQQYKRQQSREVLRTVFVCHRVPFLIPQAPAMPGGAVCGGGSWCKARLRRFSCCSQSGMGDGLWGSLFDSLNPGHPVRNRSCIVSPWADCFERKFLKILCNHHVFRMKRLLSENHMNWLMVLNKVEGSRLLSYSKLVKSILENMTGGGKRMWFHCWTH